MKEVCIHGIDLDIACNECSPPFVFPKYNPLSLDEDYYISPRDGKPHKYTKEEEDKDIKDYLNENFTRCFYCSSVFSNNEFDDDYAICGKCRDKENEE